MKKSSKLVVTKLPSRYDREEWFVILKDWNLLRGVRSFIQLDNHGRVSVRPKPEDYDARIIETLDYIEFVSSQGKSGLLLRLIGSSVHVCKICNVICVLDRPENSICDC